MAKKAVRWDSVNKDNTPLEKLVLQYQAFNRSEGKTPKTVSWYNSCLSQFVEYLRHQKIEAVLGSVGVETVREYMEWKKIIRVNLLDLFDGTYLFVNRFQDWCEIQIAVGLLIELDLLNKEPFRESALPARHRVAQPRHELVDDLHDSRFLFVDSIRIQHEFVID